MQDTCDVMSAQNTLLVMSCSVDFGSSGSPVFAFGPDGARIVSVVSSKAKSGDQPVSLGAPLEAQIDTILGMMAHGAGFPEGSVFRPLRAEKDTRKDTGAKFIRPQDGASGLLKP
jgi:V8-like Glu-specific endopeptidase